MHLGVTINVASMNSSTREYFVYKPCINFLFIITKLIHVHLALNLLLLLLVVVVVVVVIVVVY